MWLKEATDLPEVYKKSYLMYHAKVALVLAGWLLRGIWQKLQRYLASTWTWLCSSTTRGHCLHLLIQSPCQRTPKHFVQTEFSKNHSSQWQWHNGIKDNDMLLSNSKKYQNTSYKWTDVDSPQSQIPIYSVKKNHFLISL